MHAVHYKDCICLGPYLDSVVAKPKKMHAVYYKDLNKEFIFFENGFNMRSTELNAVLGLNQLKKLDKNISLRNRNYFLINLLL